jgi:hypothetical protein
MARYGLDYYGIGKYGAAGTSYIDNDASPFTAASTDYKTITLNWVVPTGSWTTLKLVRNRFGFPISIDDGDLLFTDPKTFARTSYIDKGQTPQNAGLQSGYSYHYSLFVLTSSNSWALAGHALGLAVEAFPGYSFYDALPSIFKSENFASITDSSTTNPELEQFLSIFDFSEDVIKNYAQLVRYSYDIQRTYASVIPTMMHQFGLKYEPQLGVQRSRSLLTNATEISKYKGSRLGISNFIKAFTGYEPIITVGKNLILTYNDSSFEESLGNWKCTDTTITAPSMLQYNYLQLPTVVPYAESTRPILSPNRVNAVMKITSNAAGSKEFRCGDLAPMTLGIPVSENLPYTWSIYSSTNSVARSCGLKIYWYNRQGVLISSSTETSANLSTSNSWLRQTHTATSPIGTFFAVPVFTIKNMSPNESYYFDAFQFEQGSTASVFDDSRNVNIVLKASRVNEISNPSFEYGTITPWAASGGTLSLDPTQHENYTTLSSNSLKLTATGTSTAKVKYDSFVPILPGYYYSLSNYIRSAYSGPFAGDKTGYLFMEWYDSSNTLISTSNQDVEPLTEYYTPISYKCDGGLLTINVPNDLTVGSTIRLVNFQNNLDGVYTLVSATYEYFQVATSAPSFATINVTSEDAELIQSTDKTFSNFSYSALSPANAAFSKPGFAWTNPTTTAGDASSLWFDSIVFEKANAVGPYFDGNGGFSTSTDLVWEGATGFSRSHYYKNRVVAETRVLAELTDYVMLGTSFALYVAQPGVL